MSEHCSIGRGTRFPMARHTTSCSFWTAPQVPSNCDALVIACAVSLLTSRIPNGCFWQSVTGAICPDPHLCCLDALDIFTILYQPWHCMLAKSRGDVHMTQPPAAGGGDSAAAEEEECGGDQKMRCLVRQGMQSHIAFCGLQSCKQPPPE